MSKQAEGGRPEVWCVTPSHSGGWGPVTELAVLVARLWETTVRFIHPRKEYGKATKLVSMVPRLRGPRGPLLIIAAHPGDLLSLARPEVLLGRYESVAGWVIDSFWDERLPLFARRGHILDALWITDGELVGDYARRTGLDVGWAPWGADTLRLCAGAVDKDIDVMRLGRQPAVWDDDDANAGALERIGASYQGRFEGSTTDGLRNQEVVQGLLQRSRLVLASGNAAAPGDYTHPTREYITARFTESVACGAQLVGQPPACAALAQVPDAALIRISTTDREAGLPVIREALDAWDESIAERIRRSAMQTLDWRYRIADISKWLGITAPLLQAEVSDVVRSAGRVG